MDIFNEILWPQFIKIEKYSKLQLHEQVTAYNQYLYDLSIARQNWINYQNKGPRGIVNIGLLAQEEYDPVTENYFVILQEDSSGIFVTKYIN
jgi:hypothetical protein